MRKLAGTLLLIGSTSVFAQNIAIDANAFANAYEFNGRAAEQKYAGKTIAISGIVQSVDKSASGMPRVKLDGDIVLSMAGGQTGEIEQLRIGGQIVANCMVGSGSNLPQLTGCEMFGEE